MLVGCGVVCFNLWWVLGVVGLLLWRVFVVVGCVGIVSR